MNDEKRAESVNAENGYQMIVPECMIPAEDDEQKFIVPECMEALSGYVAAETDTVEEIVEEVGE